MASHDERACTVLADALGHRNGEEAMAIVQGLARAQAGYCREALLDALRRHTDPCVRAQVIECLEDARRAQELSTLLEALSDESECDGFTLGEEREMAIIASAQGELQARMGEGPWTVDVPRNRTISAVAAAALRRWTGVEGPEPAPGASLNSAEIDVWREILCGADSPAHDP